MTTSTSRKLKVLMLHGFTQSGTLFHAKTRNLEKALAKVFTTAPTFSGVELIYPTAPIPLSAADIPGLSPTDVSGVRDEAWGWWRMPDHTTGGHRAEYAGLDEGLAHVASILREQGPFDGVVGFSQGAALAAMVASLLEPTRKEAFAACQRQGGSIYPLSFEGLDHPPLSFAVAYAGFAAENAVYKAFYDPKLETSVLSIVGSLDSVVEESWTSILIGSCSRGKAFMHPGGHFVPGGKREIAAVVDFVKEAVLNTQQGTRQIVGIEEDVLDMDVPF